MLDEAQALDHLLADGLVEAGDDLRGEVLEFHGGGAVAGEGEGAAGEFYRHCAGGELRAGEGVPVCQEMGGGGGAFAEGGAEGRGEQGGYAAGGVDADGIRQLGTACRRRLRHARRGRVWLARGRAGRHILFA